MTTAEKNKRAEDPVIQYATGSDPGIAEIVPVHVAVAAKAMLQILDREVGSGLWDDRSVREAADRVWERIKVEVSGHNADVRARLAREEERARFESMPEEERVIAKELPGRPELLEKLSVAEKRDLAQSIEDNRGLVWFVGKFDRYVDPRTLGPVGPRPRGLAEKKGG